VAPGDFPALQELEFSDCGPLLLEGADNLANLKHLQLDRPPRLSTNAASPALNHLLSLRVGNVKAGGVLYTAGRTLTKLLLTGQLYSKPLDGGAGYPNAFSRAISGLRNLRSLALVQARANSNTLTNPLCS